MLCCSATMHVRQMKEIVFEEGTTTSQLTVVALAFLQHSNVSNSCPPDQHGDQHVCGRLRNAKDSTDKIHLEERSSHLPVVQNDPLSFWSQHASSFPFIAELALDLLAASASQALVERIFSVCGMLTQGRRNRMTHSLEMRVCLKLNSRVLRQAQADV